MLPDGRVLVVGGWDGTSGTWAMASAEIYDPALGTFAPTGGLSSGRYDAQGVLLADGRVLAFGDAQQYGNAPAQSKPVAFAVAA